MSVPASVIESQLNGKTQSVRDINQALPVGWTRKTVQRENKEMIIFESKGPELGNKNGVGVSTMIVANNCADPEMPCLLIIQANKDRIAYLKSIIELGVTNWPRLSLLSCKINPFSFFDVLNGINKENYFDGNSMYDSILAFNISGMKPYLLAFFLEDFLVSKGLLSISEARYFTALLLPRCRAISKDEQENLTLMDNALKKREVEEAFELAKKIHRIVVAENRKADNLADFDDYLLLLNPIKGIKDKQIYDNSDDANALLIFAEAVMSFDPRSAYQACKLIPISSPFFRQAVGRMADASLRCYSLCDKETDRKATRELLHEALEWQARFYRHAHHEGTLHIIEQLLEVYAGGGGEKDKPIFQELFRDTKGSILADNFDAVLKGADFRYTLSRRFEEIAKHEASTVSTTAQLNSASAASDTNVLEDPVNDFINSFIEFSIRASGSASVVNANRGNIAASETSKAPKQVP